MIDDVRIEGGFLVVHIWLTMTSFVEGAGMAPRIRVGPVLAEIGIIRWNADGEFGL